MTTASEAPPPQHGGSRTLDLEHASMLRRMERDQSRASRLRAEVAALERHVAGLEARVRRRDETMSDADFDDLKASVRRLDAARTETEEAEAQADRVDYFVRTADVLFRYYDVIDKGGPASGGGAAAPPGVRPGACGGRSILSYFFEPPRDGGESAGGATAAGPPGTAVAGTAVAGTAGAGAVAGTAGAGTAGADRATLLERYMQCVKGDLSYTLAAAGAASSPHERGAERGRAAAAASACPYGPCPFCGGFERTVQLQDGLVFCNRCMTVEYVLVDHERPSYKDPPKDVSYFAYKRINHFNEWLNQVQGKETTEIPEEVYDAILLEIKKEKLTNVAKLTRKKIKDILKRLKIYKYYEHATLIISRINGIPSPNFSPELEEKLRQMFCQIQSPFLKWAPPKRRNFLSYSYCIRKMVQLLEQDQYIESFGLLKARDKLQVQDDIWKKICAELGWEFIPSL